MVGDIRSLHEKLAGGKGLSLPLIKRIMVHTLRAGLAHVLHSAGIMHTDLKQDNSSRVHKVGTLWITRV